MLNPREICDQYTHNQEHCAQHCSLHLHIEIHGDCNHRHTGERTHEHRASHRQTHGWTHEQRLNTCHTDRHTGKRMNRQNTWLIYTGTVITQTDRQTHGWTHKHWEYSADFDTMWHHTSLIWGKKMSDESGYLVNLSDTLVCYLISYIKCVWQFPILFVKFVWLTSLADTDMVQGLYVTSNSTDSILCYDTYSLYKGYNSNLPMQTQVCNHEFSL